MIIKKGFMNQSQPFKPTDPKTRIKITLRKNNKSYLNQSMIQHQLLPKELSQSNDFNDQDCFSHKDYAQKQQSKFKHFARDLSIRIIDETKKEDSTNNKNHSKKIILQSLKNRSFRFGNSKPFDGTDEEQTKMVWSERKQTSAQCQIRQMEQKKMNLTHTQLSTIHQYNSTTLKLNHENKSCTLVNPYTNKQYFHERVTHTSNHDRFAKKFNTLDYNIIKPNQIKALPLSHRSSPKSIKRKYARKHQRKNFPELVAALKRKEELELQRNCHQKRIAELRAKSNTVYLNRVMAGTVAQKNFVQPWQVQTAFSSPDLI